MGPRNGQDPLSSGGLGSNIDQMVRRVGLEPTRPYGQCLLRASRLPFRHRRNDWILRCWRLGALRRSGERVTIGARVELLELDVPAL